MTARLARRVLVGALALATLLTVVAVEQPADVPVAPAADLSRFEPGNIITDAVFTDSGSMTAAQIQSFLNLKGAHCRQRSGGPACLKDYAQKTTTRAADSLCTGRYAGSARESAAAIIKKVSVACRISPRVLLVTLQKEMGFITSSGPTSKMYSRAMGYACPDNNGGVCDSLYDGLFNQLYSAAKQFRRYAANPTRYGHVPGMWNNVRYHPNSSCGSGRVYIENQATASLYNYTPYQPNKASLAAGYAAANNACSSYGNRNFYNYFTDWFGSTQGPGRDVDAPVGRLEAVVDRGGAVLVRGWAYDPNDPVAPVQVNVYAGGTKIGSATTDRARPDVAAENFGAGSNQGFEARLALAPGRHTVCAYPVNIGAGYSNPRLGCATLTITTPAEWNPRGRVSDVRVAGTRLVVEGWSFDPDAPKWPTTVRFYAGSLRLGDIVADDEQPDVGKYYPHAGSAHGFRFESRLTPGTHRICAYAFNKGTGTTNPRLGCRTMTVTAPPLAAEITTGDPRGRLASVDLTGQVAKLRGWAFDPDVATEPITVRVWAGSKLVDETRAGGDWPDVARYYPYAGSAHGFSWSGVLPHGSYDLCVQAVDQGAGKNVHIGCRAVTVVGDPAANPKGRLVSAGPSGGKVAVTGWSFDPDVPTEPVTVRLYAGSQKLADLVADEEYADVGRYYPYAGSAHGFSWSGTLAAGSHTLCAYAFNVANGTTNPRLGCQTVTVAGAAGVGAAGQASPGPGSTDPGATDPATQDPAADPATQDPAADPAADGGTSDGGAADPGTGDGGTAAEGATGEEATRSPDPTANPRGRVASVEADGTQVRVTGWSFDPDVATEPITVRIYAGSTPVADVVADEDWPGISRYHPYAGDAHGFSWSGTLEPGTHLVCVYAINQGNGTTNPRLGCSTITVG